MVPLLLDLSGALVVIFGGGDVGARKAAFFAGEARTRVYSRSFSPRFGEIDAECVHVDLSGMEDAGLASLLKGAAMAVAATPDPALNNRIGALCREQGILFNNAEGEPGDVLIPSVVRGKNYLLAISTLGASPGVSRFLRRHLEETLPGLDAMIALQERLRSSLREVQPDGEKRRELVTAVLQDRDVWRAVEKNRDDAWMLVRERYLA